VNTERTQAGRQGERARSSRWPSDGNWDGPTVEIELTDVTHGGVCVGRDDSGRVVFARFGLPGEQVRVALTDERAKHARGDVIEVLANPSPHRVSHRWPVAGPLGVGGADLGHVTFGYQATWKTQVLASTIRRVGGEALQAHLAAAGVEPCVRSFAEDRATDGWHTRTRVDMTVDSAGAPAMFREGTRELIAVGEVPLAVEEIAELDLFSGAWRGIWMPGQRIRAVIAAGSDPVVAIGGQVFWAPGFTASPFVREDVLVDRELYSYRVRATGFWQAHRRAAGELIRLVLAGAAVQSGHEVLELYAGAGMLTQPLAVATGATGTVEAVEGNALAVEDARSNLRDMPWAKARTAKVTPALVERFAGDVVVADPPRNGLGLGVAQALASTRARRIVLVSCDPASMARDLAAMVSAGRQVIGMESVDMFPNTHHFEVVTTLR